MARRTPEQNKRYYENRKRKAQAEGKAGYYQVRKERAQNSDAYYLKLTQGKGLIANDYRKLSESRATKAPRRRKIGQRELSDQERRVLFARFRRTQMYRGRRRLRPDENQKIREFWTEFLHDYDGWQLFELAGYEVDMKGAA